MEMGDDTVYGAREGKRRGYQRSDISDQEARGKVISNQFSVLSKERKRQRPDRVGVNAGHGAHKGRRTEKREA
jgi:hypothetical protein